MAASSQGNELGKVFQQPQLLSMRGGHRAPTAAHEGAVVLRALASMGHVVLAADNPYDALYLRWTVGVRAVPWPGLSVQMAPINYTGHRPQERQTERGTIL